MPTETTCPRCDGNGRTVAFMDGVDSKGRRRGWIEYPDCKACDGQGTITTERAEQIAKGERHRKERFERDEDLTACAARYGCTPRQLIDFEFAGKPLPDGSRPTGTSDAAADC